MHMTDELVPNWDIDKSDPNLMKAMDDVFKSRCREWTFNNECVAALQQEPELPTDE
ncbi:hypothetical protein C1H46_039386 [Malus baccata]|uniref:Uncharacterized protein n=1 Tax=Malus baccata TaxID=106549 RepID=A0A540KLN7_MALBA|nr:hypothetical protein C1H46_039386 [Malus baccata]